MPGDNDAPEIQGRALATRIGDAIRQFDDVETTVSHAYSVAHPGLAA
jgi:hypothetical protein